MVRRRHLRFYAALFAGVVTFAATSTAHSLPLRVVLAGNVFFLAYLVMTGFFVARVTEEGLRRHAAADDEGLPLILLLTFAAVVLSVGAILLLLHEGTRGEEWRAAVAVAGVPLGWLTLHTVAAFHYASLFYEPRDGGVAGGIDFPGGDGTPGIWDFLYFSFVVGMTAQVSDVVVTRTAMRCSVLAHGLVAFAYNTVILAVTVNAAVTLAA